MQILNSIKQNVDAFVYVTLFIGLIQAVVAGIGFFLFNIPYPLLGGMIAGILSLLPIVGPYFLYVVVGLLLLSSSSFACSALKLLLLPPPAALLLLLLLLPSNPGQAKNIRRSS